MTSMCCSDEARRFLSQGPHFYASSPSEFLDGRPSGGHQTGGLGRPLLTPAAYVLEVCPAAVPATAKCRLGHVGPGTEANHLNWARDAADKAAGKDWGKIEPIRDDPPRPKGCERYHQLEQRSSNQRNLI